MREDEIIKKELIKNLKEQIILNTKMIECVSDEEEHKYYIKENEQARKQLKELRK